MLVALVGSAAITLTVLYLTHGITMTSTVAVLGTLASLVLTGVLAAVSVSALRLSGITDDVSSSVVTATASPCPVCSWRASSSAPSACSTT